MFDCAPTTHTYLSHDMPCPRCGHATHPYLACSDRCPCAPGAGVDRWLSIVQERPEVVGG